MKKSLLISGLLATALFTGCATGGSSQPSYSGGAAAGKNSTAKGIERCAKPMGTLAIHEDQRSDWFAYLTRNYKLTSTVPVIKTILQQTNCFVIVERGKMMNNMMQERALQQSGEMRKVNTKKSKKNRNWKNQMVAADFAINPEIFFSDADTAGAGAAAGAVGGGLLGILAGGFSKKETQVSLTMIDNRSGVQIASAIGHASATDFLGFSKLVGSGGGGALGAYSRTPEGKTLVNAFVDAINQMVVALNNYEAQSVEGGLGQGGTLEIAD